MRESELSEVEKIIGYVFKNRSLLNQALTNESYVNEHGGTGNERLEFLGDGLLNFIVAESLYNSENSDEGVLSKERAEIVSRSPLSKAVDDMGLMRYYLLGKGAEKNLQSISEKFKSNIFESVLGAIYLDGGMKSAKAFVKFKLLDKRYRAARDYKSELKERAEANGIGYSFKTEPSERGFSSVLSVCGKEFYGSGRKKIDAEQQAAKNALDSRAI
ncbi:ribonuclease III family protein [Pumilibacter muris]|uniref:ribonuclease III family protein n=1 Tax=Pumilibacter muris TaxID=2941510 RepID=UPI00203EA04B|nr:ribonuclease III domain-containing protein [Pumilibacter muris]